MADRKLIFFIVISLYYFGGNTRPRRFYLPTVIDTVEPFFTLVLAAGDCPLMIPTGFPVSCIL
ncbi:MAG: hypothetical protein A2X34_03915 [Elusimicrobia bacterium GWC2_51_8]|nr:MAG: hypothetical protein A2X34_03915 [Elusimicrobia bacterium GWC2_51_8]